MELQDVKKYFENAEFVQTRSFDEKRKVNLKSIGFDLKGDFWCTEEETGYVFNVFSKATGFAKILTTKEKTFSITRDQILKLENGFTTENLSKWFPEVFEDETITKSEAEKLLNKKIIG